MLYRFNSNELIFKQLKFKNYIIGSIALFILLTTAYTLGRFTKLNNLSEYEKNILLINMKQEPFSEEKLIALMKELNIKFPHIVMAQSKLETNNFKSGIFKENHNLFGMKEARVRINTAKGTNLNHAYYDNWQESVYDYAFYQCRYMSDARTEQDYFAALDASYAEANKYSATLKHIIQKENLRQIFK